MDLTQAAGDERWLRLAETVWSGSAGATFTLPDPSGGQTSGLLTLTAAVTLTFPNPVKGLSFTLGVAQDATGSRLVTWPGSVKWAGGVAPVLSTGAGKVDVFSFTSLDGVSWLGFFAGKGF